MRKMNRAAVSPVLREFWMHGLDGLNANDFITHCGTTVASGRRGPLECSRGLENFSVDQYHTTFSPVASRSENTGGRQRVRDGE